ncbi:MAG TPA: tetratricopeptide repeat protein [Acidobacteriaceae bacterium]|jgi:tetratricopeptide (TPR) repeat protein
MHSLLSSAQWRRLLSTAILLAVLIPAAGTASAAQMSAADGAKLQQALTLYDQGRSQEAQPLLQELLVRHPANFNINETLGLIHAEAGDFSTALPLLERAARLDPQAALARVNLGTAYLKLNQPRKALPELEAAARLQPGDQQTQSNLAHAYMETAEPAKAAQAFAAAAALGPLDADTSHDRALALLQSNDASGAKQVLDALPQGNRNDAIEELAGETEEHLGNYRQAEEHFSEAAHLNPSEPNIYAWVVELLRHFSWQPAVKIADYGIQQFPTSTRLKSARGIALYADNRYKEAAVVFSDLLVADSGNATWASLLGRNCALIADVTATGCENLQHFAEQHPQNAEAATYAATALLHQPAEKRDDSKARALLQQAIAADPRLADAYYQLGVLDQEETRWQESTAPLKKAITLQPALAEAHYRLARAYSHLGRRDDAAREIELQQRYAKEQKQSVDARLKEVTTFLTKTQ